MASPRLGAEHIPKEQPRGGGGSESLSGSEQRPRLQLALEMTLANVTAEPRRCCQG